MKILIASYFSFMLLLTGCLKGGENPELSSLSGILDQYGSSYSGFSGVRYVEVTSPTMARVYWNNSGGMGFAHKIYVYQGASLESVINVTTAMSDWPITLIPFASYRVLVRRVIDATSGLEDGNNNFYSFVMDPSVQPARISSATINFSPTLPSMDLSGNYFLFNSPSHYIEFNITFNEPVTVSSGTPRIPVNIDGDTYYANFFSASTSTLNFRLSIAGLVSFSNVVIGTSFNSIDLNGGTIKRTSNGIDAELNPITYMTPPPGFKIFPQETKIFRVGIGSAPVVVGTNLKLVDINELLSTGANQFNTTTLTSDAPNYYGSGFGPNNRPYIKFLNSNTSYLRNSSFNNIHAAIFVIRAPSVLSTVQNILQLSGTNIIALNVSGDLSFTTAAYCSINGSGFSALDTSCNSNLSPNSYAIIAVKFSSAISGGASLLHIGKDSSFELSEFIFFNHDSITDSQLLMYSDHLRSRFGI